MVFLPPTVTDALDHPFVILSYLYIYNDASFLCEMQAVDSTVSATYRVCLMALSVPASYKRSDRTTSHPNGLRGLVSQ